MLYPAPKSISFETGIPYLMAIHDLQHLLHPEFPEVSANGEWERREYLFRNGARYALTILVGSQAGKEDVLGFYGKYGVSPDRVRILPYLPATYLKTEVPQSDKQRVARKYNLPSEFLFYPAHFWLHKNHAGIIHALKRLKIDYKVQVPIVFSGSHSGRLRKQVFGDVVQLTRDLGLQGQVNYLGYVPDADMSSLYAMAIALVMPTFFGPNVIPPLEAFAFGCPVVTSNIRGFHERVGGAAVLVDPHSSDDIAQGVYRIVSDTGLRKSLVQRGHAKLSDYTPTDYAEALRSILQDAKCRTSSR
jgi:glycosyltransferase involved in cell wall biosynthesis